MYFLTVLEAGKSKIKAPGESGSDETALVSESTPSHCVLRWRKALLIFLVPPLKKH